MGKKTTIPEELVLDYFKNSSQTNLSSSDRELLLEIPEKEFMSLPPLRILRAFQELFKNERESMDVLSFIKHPNTPADVFRLLVESRIAKDPDVSQSLFLVIARRPGLREDPVLFQSLINSRSWPALAEVYGSPAFSGPERETILRELVKVDEKSLLLWLEAKPDFSFHENVTRALFSHPSRSLRIGLIELVSKHTKNPPLAKETNVRKQSL